MKKILIIFIALLFSIPSYAGKIVDIDFTKGNGTLVDSKGNLTSPSLIRDSATTDADGNLLQGSWSQLIDTDAQNDITDAWWTKSNITGSTANAMIASGGNTSHFFRTDSIGNAGSVYMFSAELKAGTQNWATFRIYNIDNYIYFDLNNGVVGTNEGTWTSPKITSTGDGWFLCSAVYNRGVDTSRVYVYSAEDDGDITFDDDGSTVLEIRNIMLVELPSDMTIGDDLFDQEATTSRTSGASTVVGTIYRIVTQNTLDFTTVGAPNNTVGTVFIADAVDTLGAGDELDEITSPHKGTYGWPYSAWSELITDTTLGTDILTKGTGWSHDAGNTQYDCSGAQSADSDLTENVITGAGLHRVSFTVSNYSAGNVAGLADTTEGTDVSANGTYDQYIYADSAGVGGVRADSSFVGSIDDISIRPIQTSWVPYGTNTIEIDEDNDNEEILITFVDNAAGAKLALADAQDLSEDLTVDSYYQVNLSAKYANDDGADPTIAIRNQADDTDLATATLTTSYVDYEFVFQATHATGDFIKFGNMSGSEAVYIKDLTIKEIPDLSILTDSPNYENSATLTAEPVYDSGLILNGYGINLLPYSEDFTQWANSNTTDSANLSGPDGGTNNATTLTATAANGTIKYTLSSTVSGAEETFSIWMKRITGTGNIDMTLDDGSTWTTKTLSSDWTRFHIYGTETAPVVGIRIVADGDAIGIFGAQLNPNNYWIQYKPTDGCPVFSTTEVGEDGVSGLSYTMSSVVTSALNTVGEVTLIAELEMLQDYDAVDTGQRGLVAVNEVSTGASILNFSATEGDFHSWAIDGGACSTAITLEYSEDDLMTVVARLTAEENDLNISGKLNGSWDMDTQVSCSSVYEVGTKLWLMYTEEGTESPPVKFKRLVVYDGYLRDNDVQNEIWKRTKSEFPVLPLIFDGGDINPVYVDSSYFGMAWGDGDLMLWNDGEIMLWN